MMRNANYPCGCKVRHGKDPLDGVETTRLYPCGPIEKTECIYARAVVTTLKMMAETEEGTTVESISMSKGQTPPPLTPLSDEPPEEFEDRDFTKPPEDLHLSCGCSCSCGFNDAGEKQLVFASCSKGRECPSAELFSRLSESTGIPLKLKGVDTAEESEKARITIDDPLRSFEFSCGCKVAPATRSDGQSGFALVTCEGGEDCPGAREALSRLQDHMGGRAPTVQDFEIAGEVPGGPPPDREFECGCRTVFGIGEDGEKTAYLYACEAGPECRVAALFIKTAKESIAENPGKTYTERVLKTIH
jgi:hypothetical protein